jgi:7,8-dihydropterin-6-yl-methyl-4-(beta-D-ribofuranosyl)aminobenzene 5'-phosphate synthase
VKRRTFIKTLLLSAGYLITGPHNLTASALDKNTIRILMLYNNVGSSTNLASKWGVSIWIEDKDTAVLFDTGGDSSTMWDNLAHSGVNIKKLSKTVISHNHWDHVNGLPVILEKSNYMPEVFVPNFDLTLIEIKNPTGRLSGIETPVQINNFLWSTGQMKSSAWFGTIHEQSLAIIQNDSIYLLTGCAHPGIVKIVERTINYLPDKRIDLIIGGFHLMRQSDHQIKEISSELKRLRVKKIAPSHCTGEQAIKIFKEEWQENFIDLGIGNTTSI